MVRSMSDLDQYGEDYDSAFQSIQDRLADMRRELSAGVMSQYPDIDNLVLRASQLFQAIEPGAVMVQVVLHDKQVTMCSMPPRAVKQVTVKPNESLSSLTVGFGKSLVIDDVQKGTWLEDHAVRSEWGSWASFPIKVAGEEAGALVTMHYEAHHWTDDELDELERYASHISRDIDEWSGNTEFEGMSK